MVKSPSSITPIYNPSLSAREVALLARWERERRHQATHDDIRHAVGDGPAVDVARALVKKGVLLRLRPGLYLVRPFRSLSRPTAPSAVMSLAVLLQAEPYYLGGLWASSFHRLTEQQNVSILDAFTQRRHLARQLGGGQVVFHVLPRRLLEYGITRTTVEGVDVAVSDLERTLLDALDHPRVVGGLRRGMELFQAGFGRADPRKVVEFAVRGSRASTCRRLGVILERARIPERALGPLRRRLEGSRSLLSMIPGGRTGPVNKRWNVVENDR
jgi:predicted transcriptional regulator of viral defense system